MPVIEKVDGAQALERVEDALGSLSSEAKLNQGDVDITCAPENLVEVVTALRDAVGIRCRFFMFLSGVDRSGLGEEDTEQPHPLEVLVHLYSPEHTIHATVRVPLAAGQGCPTITGVFAGANWHEREAYEMFGIDFEGHPGLVNLYLPEDFEGHPLLKSFKLPSRIIKPWPGAKDSEEAGGGS
jgi:NADH-quinone oxidoreductase subunit C